MSDTNEREPASATMKYIGLGTQLMVFMGLGVWGGHQLDERIRVKALFVIVFPLVALTYSLWQLIKTLNKK